MIDTRAVKGLAGYGTESGTASPVIPDAVQPGLYHLLAKADAELVVCESDESNNIRTKPIYVGPDLTVTLPWVSGDAVAGGTLTFRIEVKNSGTAVAAPSTARLYLSRNYSGGGDGDAPLIEMEVPALAAGGVWKPLALSATIPATIEPGFWYLIAAADASGVVPEARETNNQRTRSLTIY